MGYVVKQSGPRAQRPPGGIDTRPLAEGMSHKQWKAARKKQHAEKLRRWCQEQT